MHSQKKLLLYEYHMSFFLVYDVNIKCCGYAGASNVAGTYFTHLLSLQCCVIQKSLHNTKKKIYIDMVVKNIVFYCIV